MSGIVKSEDAIAAHHAALVDGAHFGILSRPLPCASLNTWLQPAEGAHFSNRILSAADYNRTKRGLGSSTAQPPPPSYHDVGDVGDNKAEVAAHYDRLKDRHRTLETGSEILRLRNLNNWIKSALFQKHLFRGQKGRSGPAVLDLACGKGGDMLKFRASDIATYVGVDIAANSVRDAVRRYNGMDGRPGMPFGATFMVGDFCASSISERLPAHLASTRFQVASCQFAMHYAFDTEARATALLANAAGRLEVGHGVFVATIPDANVLVKRLRASSGLSFGNSLYRVEFSQKFASKAFAANASPFGIAYSFSLKEAVEECEEYLVHLPTLKKLARAQGLELLYAANFTDFFANEWAHHSGLLERMKVLPTEGSLSQEEWDVAHTYMVVAFRRFAREGETALPPQPVPNTGHRDQSPETDIIFLSDEAQAKAAAEAQARLPPKAKDDLKDDDSDEEEELDGGSVGGGARIKRDAASAGGAGDGGAAGSSAGSKRPRSAVVKEEREQTVYNDDELFN